jgi:hypothetical protein
MDPNDVKQPDLRIVLPVNGATSPAEWPNIKGAMPTFEDFDPKKLRLSQNFADGLGVKKLLTTVPTRKPHRQQFFRVHPDPDWREQMAVLTVKDGVGRNEEPYLLHPDVYDAVPDGELTPVTIFTCIDLQKVVLLWPCKFPRADGRSDEWARTAREGAERAMKMWVKVAANIALGAYEVFPAIADYGEPEWPPDVTFQKLLEVGFRDRFIRSADHIVLERLRGAR